MFHKPVSELERLQSSEISELEAEFRLRAIERAQEKASEDLKEQQAQKRGR